MDKKTMQLLDRVKNEIANRMFAQERAQIPKVIYYIGKDDLRKMLRRISSMTSLYIQNYSTLNFLTTKAILLL